MNPTKESVIVMKVLSNMHRYTIMKVLLRTKEDLCVNEIAEATGISQSLASQQLTYLQTHGLIVGHRVGKTVCYLPAHVPITKKIEQVINVLS